MEQAEVKPQPPFHVTSGSLSKFQPQQVAYMRVMVVGGFQDPWGRHMLAQVQCIDRKLNPTSEAFQFVEEGNLISQAELIRIMGERR